MPNQRPLLRVIPLLAAALTGCGESRQSVQLAGGVDVLPGDTVTFDAPEPLKTPARSATGRLCVEVRRPLRRSRDSVAILTPTGASVHPVAFAIRADGGRDRLSMLSYNALDAVCFGPEAKVSQHPPYAAVKLVSPAMLTLDRVYWLSEDP